MTWLGASLLGPPLSPRLTVPPLLNKSNSRAYQIAAIISVIFALFLLSSFGFLSPAVAITCKVAFLTTATFFLTSATNMVADRILKKNPLEKTDSRYSLWLGKLSPLITCIEYPIGEEILFRGIGQGGLNLILKQILPPISISLLGVTLPVATLSAIVVAGGIFGAVHGKNPHEEASRQAVLTGVGGVVDGFLCHRYGLWSAILSHCINNTIAISLLELSIPK